MLIQVHIFEQVRNAVGQCFFRKLQRKNIGDVRVKTGRRKVQALSGELLALQTGVSVCRHKKMDNVKLSDYRGRIAGLSGRLDVGIAKMPPGRLVYEPKEKEIQNSILVGFLQRYWVIFMCMLHIFIQNYLY